jgi:predicted PurR-regulated permease PerM
MPGVPVNLRSAALWVIAVIVSLAALRFASAVFVPLVVGVMLSYALTPLVNQIVRLYIPRVLAAAMRIPSRSGQNPGRSNAA